MCNVEAGGALVAGLEICCEGLAVEGFGKKARKGRFASSTAAAEEISRGDFPELDRVFKGCHNGILANDAFEGLRAASAVPGGGLQPSDEVCRVKTGPVLVRPCRSTPS